VKVAAYITAYEDPATIQQCFKGINQQTYPLERIFIIDNSSRNCLTLSTLQSNIPIVIQSHPENIGVAGGLRVALKWAFEHGYDFLWSFDQDSIPASDCLEKLLKTYHTFNCDHYRIAIIAPTAIDPRTQTIAAGANFENDQFVGCNPPNSTTCYECDAPITSGSLVSLDAARSVFSQSPCAFLFIDGVDFEFGMSLKKKGYHNLIVPQAQLHHQFGTPLTVQWRGKKKQFYKYSPLRHYYICRNYTYLVLHYSQGKYKLSALRCRLSYLLKMSVMIFLFDQQDKVKKVLACWRGTFDGLMKQLGKY